MIFPKADIPVLQLSLKKNLDPKEHFELGIALRELRNDDILIIGSGFLTHNMNLLFSKSIDCENFAKWCKEKIILPKNQRDQFFINWKNAPGAEIAHPREEHLIPLHVVLGSTFENDKTSIIYDEMINSFSMTSFMFG